MMWRGVEGNGGRCGDMMMFPGLEGPHTFQERFSTAGCPSHLSRPAKLPIAVFAAGAGGLACFPGGGCAPAGAHAGDVQPSGRDGAGGGVAGEESSVKQSVGVGVGRSVGRLVCRARWCGWSRSVQMRCRLVQPVQLEIVEPAWLDAAAQVGAEGSPLTLPASMID